MHVAALAVKEAMAAQESISERQKELDEATAALALVQRELHNYIPHFPEVLCHM